MYRQLINKHLLLETDHTALILPNFFDCVLNRHYKLHKRKQEKLVNCCRNINIFVNC